MTSRKKNQAVSSKKHDKEAMNFWQTQSDVSLLGRFIHYLEFGEPEAPKNKGGCNKGSFKPTMPT